MKHLLTVVAAIVALSTSSLAADPAGPAEKKDGGSLSSGAKEASPATKGQGENAPDGGAANDGASTGAADSTGEVPAEAGKNTPDTKGAADQ